MAATRLGVEEITRHFHELEDPRSEVNRLHPLEGVIVIALLAVLAGASGPTAIAQWAKLKRELLAGVLDLPRPALFLAGKASARYRRQAGPKTNVLADFFIGARAAVIGCPVLTRDVRPYKAYFPSVRLISP